MNLRAQYARTLAPEQIPAALDAYDHRLRELSADAAMVVEAVAEMPDHNLLDLGEVACRAMLTEDKQERGFQRLEAGIGVLKAVEAGIGVLKAIEAYFDPLCREFANDHWRDFEAAGVEPDLEVEHG